MAFLLKYKQVLYCSFGQCWIVAGDNGTKWHFTSLHGQLRLVFRLLVCHQFMYFQYKVECGAHISHTCMIEINLRTANPSWWALPTSWAITCHIVVTNLVTINCCDGLTWRVGPGPHSVFTCSGHGFRHTCPRIARE